MHDAGLGVTSWVTLLGFVGAALTLCVYSMKRMIPLRIVGICSNCVLLAYGLLAGIYPQVIMSAIILPINLFRLNEMLSLVRKVKRSAAGDLDMEWLKPFMSRKTARRGETIFRKGDKASDMYYPVSGLYRLTEIKHHVRPGEVVGELGLIAPESKRTLTLTCEEDGELLTISYDHVKQLFFQNPEFGFYFLQLISRRLFNDIERSRQVVRADQIVLPPSPSPGAR
jgi:hypothetical protein